jgi:uncharacterized membrane protein YbhN (UPF0104 family)
MALHKTRMIIAALVIAVIILASFIGISYYASYTARQQQVIYTAGYQQAIIDVVNASTTCETVPLTLGNQTFGLVNIACLQSQTQNTLTGNTT